MMLKACLVLGCLLFVITPSEGGVGITTAEVEAEAYRLWNQFCADASSDGGNDGGLFVYCKRSREDKTENFEHKLELPSKSGQEQQIVFIQPPSYHYNHEVLVSGGGVAARRTVIYVKPAKNTHEINVQDNTQAGEGPKKPTVFFLKGAHGGQAEATTEASPEYVPPPPDNTYLPPPDNTYLPPQETTTAPPPPPPPPPATYLPPTEAQQEQSPEAGYRYPAPRNPLRYKKSPRTRRQRNYNRGEQI